MNPDSLTSQALDASPETLPAAVLWDMDGTLVDTEPHWIAAETALLGRYGATWSHEQALQLVGSALPDSGRILADHLEATTGVRLDPAAVVSELIDAVIAEVSAAVVWRPGALELLRALGAAGVPCALVTMSYRNLADTVGALVPGAFAVVVAGDEVTRGKPAPDPYLRAAELLGVDVTDCVVIEDSPTGVASGEAAGAHVLACPHMVPIPTAPGRNRVGSLAEVGVASLSSIVGGRLVDTLAESDQDRATHR